MSTVEWVEFQSHNETELKELALKENIHPLALEDCIHREQRPKFEDFGNHQFLVWFMLKNEQLYELQFLIFPTKIILVAHEPPPEGLSWKQYFKLTNQHKDTWHLLYQALDRATDHSWLAIKSLVDEIEDVEQSIFDRECDPRELLALKKRLNKADLSINHLSSLVLQMQNFYQAKDDLGWKFRDLFDHCERINKHISVSRAQVATVIDLYWGLLANKTNRHIKKLSLLASISVPLTFWASVWGMNFEIIPFGSHKFFMIAVALMITSVLGTAWLLIRKGYWND